MADKKIDQQIIFRCTLAEINAVDAAVIAANSNGVGVELFGVRVATRTSIVREALRDWFKNHSEIIREK